jgi:type I restriction enzyme S subunit
MSSEWLTAPLENCLDALIDYRGKTPEKTETGIPLITAKFIKGGRIETPTEFISTDAYDSWMRRGIPKAGDVVLTVEAPLGEVAQLGPEKIALAQRVVTLRGKSGVLDSTYLLYLLQSEGMQDALKARATGTTVLGIKQSELRKVVVTLPPLSQQIAAASTLKSIDDRITLIHETNATLEAIAQALFKSWFVDFDPVRAKRDGRAPEGMDEATTALFPDSFEDSELGEVPKGWKAGSLGQVAQVARRQLQPDEMRGDAHYVGLEHIPRKSLSLTGWGVAKGLESAKACFAAGDILFGKLRPYFHKVVIAPVAGVCSTDILVCQPKASSQYALVAMHLFSEALVTYADRLSNGAKMPRVNWKDLADYRMVVPPLDIADAFTKSLQPMFDRMTANVFLAQTLSALRDTLLPRLISGQLRLPEATEILEEALA